LTATTTEVNLERTELPSRLVFENPAGLVSLHDMLKIRACDFISIGSGLQNIESQLASRPDQRPAWEQAFEEYLNLLNFIELGAWDMGLTHTGKIARSIRDEQRGKTLSNEDIRRSLKEINRSFVQELESQVFLYINGPNTKWLHRNDAFGSVVANSFRTCTADIWAAGNCLALELYDSCVFHLMRVVERGLAVMAAKFNVPSDQRNWHNIIEEIESAIRKMDRSWGTDWKSLQSQYAEVACQFMFFKQAWRNHVAHGRDTYDLSRTMTILIATEHFMNRLADMGLSE